MARRNVEVQVITTPNRDGIVLPINNLSNFKQSVLNNTKNPPEKNPMYREFKAQMSSAKAR
jgi:hypothetical protein